MFGSRLRLTALKKLAKRSALSRDPRLSPRNSELRHGGGNRATSPTATTAATRSAIAPRSVTNRRQRNTAARYLLRWGRSRPAKPGASAHLWAERSATCCRGCFDGQVRQLGVARRNARDECEIMEGEAVAGQGAHRPRDVRAVDRPPRQYPSGPRNKSLMSHATSARISSSARTRTRSIMIAHRRCTPGFQNVGVVLGRIADYGCLLVFLRAAFSI